MNTGDDGDVVTVALGVLGLKQVHVAYNISKIIQTLGGEGKSSVKAEANGIAINS